MSTSKHTIKECKVLLRSCLSMLDSLSAPSLSNLLNWRGRCYKDIAHLLAVSPESQLTEPWLYERIVVLYNEINAIYISL